VDPRALVPDVRQVEEVLVEPRLADGAPEEGLVGAGGARGDDHPVEVVLPDALLDQFLGVGGAGVHVVLGVDHSWEAPGVLGDGLHVHHASYVGAAVADEDADAGLGALHVQLLRQVVPQLHPRPAPQMDRRGPGRRAGGLGHRLGDVLGTREGAADEDAWPRGGHGVARVGGGKSVPVGRYVEGLEQSGRPHRGGHAHREDDQVELPLPQQPVRVVLVVKDEVPGPGDLVYAGDATAGEADAVLVLGALVVVLELLAHRPDVHEEDVQLLDVRRVLLRDDGLLDCGHAAEGRAVSLGALVA
jgi:hypothetical protein